MKTESGKVYILIHPENQKRVVKYSTGETREYDPVVAKLLDMGFKLDSVYSDENESLLKMKKGTPVGGFPL